MLVCQLHVAERKAHTMPVTFNQQGQEVDTQYNAETIQIGAATSISDMARNIATLKAEISTFKQVPDSVRKEVLEALDAAEKRSPSPNNTSLKAKLDAAGAALSSFDGVTEKAIKLAQTIF